MTFSKGIALVLAFVGAVALGIWIGPHVTHRDTVAVAPTAQAPDSEQQQAAPVARRAPAPQRATAKSITTTASTMKRTPAGATPRTVPAAAPALHDVLKPLLNKGADMGLASEEFVNAEQFAAVAHASRNTELPFMVLKHRVVEEGKSLEAAIRELKPSVNADAEADRARAQAKSDVLSLLG